MTLSTPPSTRSRKGLLFVVALIMAGAALVALVLGSMKDTSVYSKPVDELLAAKSTFEGKQVRAEGNLVHGSLQKRDTPCEYRFELERGGKRLPVSYKQCVVPDTFRDIPDTDVGVTVEGKLLADNHFEASLVLAKCPSKYEMDERAKRGEQMPHGQTSSSAPSM